MLKLLNHFLLLLLFVIVFAQSNAQVYDLTMSPNASGYSFGASGGMSPCVGTRNYIPDGNFNYFRVNTATWSCSGGYAQYNNGTWSGNNQIQGPCGWLYNVYGWPYSFRTYCSSPAAWPFSVGVAQVDFYKRSNLTTDYRNYIRADLLKPLNIGQQYLFEMDVISAFATSDSNKLQIDKIGACFMQNLPTVSAGLPLTSLTPQITTAIDTPVINSAIHLSGTIIGNGEKYLLIGVFDSLNNITFNSTPGVTANATYYIDNVHLYRPACNNAIVYIGTDSGYACPGDTFHLFAANGVSPYTWRLNGSLLPDTLGDIQIPVGLNDQILTVTVDTGICIDSSSFLLRSRWLTLTMPTDTFKFCDSSVTVPPMFNYHNTNLASITYTAWTGLTTNYFSGFSTPFSPIFPDTGLYEVNVSYNYTCSYLDTIHISPRIQLLATDSSGNPYLLPEIIPEHCINMYDGEIIVHNINYPSPLHYRWYQPVATTADTNAVYNLGYGWHHAVIWDNQRRCTNFPYYVPQTLDSCTLIKGTAYLDRNYNCVNDSLDAPLSYVRVNALPLPNAGFTDTAGHYQILVPPGNYTMQRIYPDTTIGNFCSDTLVATLFAGEVKDSVDFADTLRVYTHNLSLDYLYSDRLRFAHLGSVTIGVTNRGDTTENFIMKIYIHHPNLLVDTNLIPGFIGLSGDTLLIASIVYPQQTELISIPVEVLTDLSYVGSSVTFYAHCETVANLENNYSDNEKYLTEYFFASYDPNDKSVTPAETVIDTTQRNFIYTVRFQNTGNYYATHVYIKDTVSNNLDLSTLELLTTSHHAQVYILGQIIIFDFPSIILPDSGTDEAHSHGYVQYRIYAKNNATLGDVISNTAYIYFDANPAVATNTVRNTYGITTSLSVDNAPSKDFISIELVPNPANEFMAVSIKSDQRKKINYSITDLEGKYVMKGILNNAKTLIDISTLTNGSYLFIANDGKHTVTKKLIKL